MPLRRVRGAGEASEDTSKHRTRCASFNDPVQIGRIFKMSVIN